MSQTPQPLRGDSFLRPFTKTVNFIYRCFVRVFLVLSVVLVLIVSSDVILRWFGYGIIWADEMSRMLMIWMAFFAMAMGVEIGSHVEITMFFKMLPAKFQKVWTVVNSLITIFIGGFIAYYGVLLFKIGLKGKLEIVRALPKSAMYITIPIGGFFIVYFALMRLLGRTDLLPSALDTIYPKRHSVYVPPDLPGVKKSDKGGSGV
jgi:TRAP-type transport system small permease protein